VEAAWFHHRFTQIHPFADGNGRVARAIASLVFIKADWFPLVVKRDDWVRYVEMLEQADQGDLRPLVAMFVEAQRNAVIQASEAAFDIKPISSTDEAIAAVRDRLMQRGKLPLREWLKANDTAGQLVVSATKRFQAIAQQLREEIASLGGRFSFQAASGNGGTGDPALKKAIQEASHTPDFDEYNKLVFLKLAAGRSDVLVLSFYALGPRYHGFIGVVAYLALEGAEPIMIQDGRFQINYAEELSVALSRFDPWLERVIVEGLNQWRRTL
jgi:hypothetical protein